MAKTDSLLVTGQVTGEFQAKDPQMVAYLEYVHTLKGSFAAFELIHVGATSVVAPWRVEFSVQGTTGQR